MFIGHDGNSMILREPLELLNHPRVGTSGVEHAFLIKLVELLIDFLSESRIGQFARQALHHQRTQTFADGVADMRIGKSWDPTAIGQLVEGGDDVAG